MKVYRTDEIRNVVLLGHGGSGKTSLAEAMLYVSGATNRMGKISESNTVSDFDKEELKNEIRQSFEKYISEFDTIPEALKDKRVPDVDRTPAENLAYQVGWTALLLKWEADEQCGVEVKTPSEQFKWNQLGSLYQWFTDTYAHLSLAELKGKLNENIAAIQAMIDSMSEEELFQPHMRRWADDATKAAVWEVYKFIHVNTVAPFGTFRTKIRKWKKAAL